MSEPFWQQIVNDVRQRIASGEWPPGHKLPSTRALVAQYRAQLEGGESIAPSTVRQAISILIALGELRGQQGLGVFVAYPPSAQSAVTDP
jgi:GntR family transcriptional regulator